MNIQENLSNSLSTIWANKLRSGLTMLGIVIGIASVIVMVAIGTGAQGDITARLQSLGTNLLIVVPGGNSDIRAVFRGSSGGSLSNDDMDVIRNIDNVKGLSPEASTNKQLIFGKVNSRAKIVGVLPEYLELKDKTMLYGSFFTSDDELKRSKVGVIDETVWKDLFSNENPLGKDIRIENSIFTIIGIVKGEDGNMYVPFSTAQIRVLGQRSINQINVFVSSATEMTTVQTNIENALLKAHNLASKDSADFTVISQTQILDTVNQVTGIFTMLLGGIAAISLIVGGIGVMNIMLVSVTERTREIGIRKAVGAHRKDILLQFLTESVVLSLLGGIIGILLSVLVVYGVSKSGVLSAVISMNSIILACSFAIGTGIVFGILPAYKASRLKPIDALRFE